MTGALGLRDLSQRRNLDGPHVNLTFEIITRQIDQYIKPISVYTYYTSIILIEYVLYKVGQATTEHRDPEAKPD
jgi:hypothetical protein